MIQNPETDSVNAKLEEGGGMVSARGAAAVLPELASDAGSRMGDSQRGSYMKYKSFS